MTDSVDSRYPYTYACDLMRSFVDVGGLSRAEASMIRQGVAKVLGIDDEELAKKLADYYLVNQESVDTGVVNKFLSSQVHSPDFEEQEFQTPQFGR